jgi:hypothetical protein
MQRKIQKTYHRSQTRILALDLHPRRFGYVVMEGPERLLDWGVKRSCGTRTNHPDVLISRLRSLLKMWMPDTVLARIGAQRKTDVRAVFRRIKKEVSAPSFVPIKHSPDHYLGQGKYERTVAIATRFPEINWKLPPKRKLGDSEHYSMSIFEALQIAAVYVS